MRPIALRARLAAVAVLAVAAWTVPADAAQLNITVTNVQPGGGFAFSPVWFGVHDGTFDDFDAGSTASSQVTSLAELGDSGGIAALFSGHGAGTVVVSSGAIPQFKPMDTGSGMLTVSNPAVDQYLSFGAMVVPSNDLFFGNDDPTGYRLFDASGHFMGPLTITIYGSGVWDAQTEVDDINVGAAFINGEDATLGTQISNGHITAFLSEPNASDYLASINGLDTPFYTMTHLISGSDPIATITITSVPEPGAIGLLAAGAIGGLWLARGRRRGTAGMA